MKQYVSNNRGFSLIEGLLLTGATAMVIGAMSAVSTTTQALKKTENLTDEIYNQRTGTQSCAAVLNGKNVTANISINDFDLGGQPATQVFAAQNVTQADLEFTKVSSAPTGEQILEGDMLITANGRKDVKTITAIAHIDGTGNIQDCGWGKESALRAQQCTENGGILSNGACLWGARSGLGVSATAESTWEWLLGAVSNITHTNFLEAVNNRQHLTQMTNTMKDAIALVQADPGIAPATRTALNGIVTRLEAHETTAGAVAAQLSQYAYSTRAVNAALMSLYQGMMASRLAGGGGSGETTPIMVLGQISGSTGSYVYMQPEVGESITEGEFYPSESAGFNPPAGGTTTAGP